MVMSLDGVLNGIYMYVCSALGAIFSQLFVFTYFVFSS